MAAQFQRFLIFVVGLVLAGCGSSTSLTPTTQGSTSTVFATGVEIKSDETVAAYVIDFSGYDLLSVYIPSTDQYAVIHESTGVYSADHGIYYSGTHCTGSAYAAPASGVIGKTILSDGTNYFLVSSEFSRCPSRS